jgi:dihydroorotate dehydrogenase
VYRGFGLVQEIKQALLAELEKEGLGSVQDLIGVDAGCISG